MTLSPRANMAGMMIAVRAARRSAVNPRSRWPNHRSGCECASRIPGMCDSSPRLGSTILATSSPWEVFRALFCVNAVQDSGGLADFDQVAVRVAHVAADLRLAVDRWREEFRALRFPFLIAGLDVSDPQVEEDRGRVAGLVVSHRDAWLVRRGRAAGVHKDPRVGQLDHARVLLQDHGAAQDARV